MKKPVDVMLDKVEWVECEKPTEADAAGMPYVTHKGSLIIGEIELDCVVLNTGERLFTTESLKRFFGEDVLEFLGEGKL